MTSADDERARGFGVEGDDEAPDLRNHNESQALAHGLAVPRSPRCRGELLGDAHGP